jgi:hypothetical protein
MWYTREGSTCRVLAGKLEGRELLGRSGCRWEDIKLDLR